MNYKFIDLFAGIGGFRIGFESQGFECVFSSENNPHACDVYARNFGDTPDGDITKIDSATIPSFDILLAGFPCQPFSIAGAKMGFNDTRGTLFFDIMRIATHHKPRAIVLENVKHFKNHDKGNTLSVTLSSLESAGYKTNWKILNAKDFGVPQNRARIIIVATLDTPFDFSGIQYKPQKNVEHILTGDLDQFDYLDESEYTLIDMPKKQRSGLIFVGYRNKAIRKTGVRAGTRHLSRVHKQPNRIYSSEGTHPTISSQETSGRYYIYHQGRVRKLTLSECFALMGFPDDFKITGPRSKLYKRIGNSVAVPMIEEVARQIKMQFF